MSPKNANAQENKDSCDPHLLATDCGRCFDYQNSTLLSTSASSPGTLISTPSQHSLTIADSILRNTDPVNHIPSQHDTRSVNTSVMQVKSSELRTGCENHQLSDCNSQTTADDLRNVQKTPAISPISPQTLYASSAMSLMERSMYAGRAACRPHGPGHKLASRTCPPFARSWLAVVGSDIVSDLLSNAWQSRVAALDKIASDIKMVSSAPDTLLLIVSHSCSDPVRMVFRAGLGLFAKIPRMMSTLPSLQNALAHIVLRCHDHRPAVVSWCHAIISAAVAGGRIDVQDIRTCLYSPPPSMRSLDTRSWRWLLGSARLLLTLLDHYPQWFMETKRSQMDSFIAQRSHHAHRTVREFAIKIQQWVTLHHKGVTAHLNDQHSRATSPTEQPCSSCEHVINRQVVCVHQKCSCHADDMNENLSSCVHIDKLPTCEDIEVCKVIGQGSSGKVYIAYCTHLGWSCAVKQVCFPN